MPTKFVCPNCESEVDLPFTEDEILEHSHLDCPSCGRSGYYGAWFAQTNKAIAEKAIAAGEPRDIDEALARVKDCFGRGPVKPPSRSIDHLYAQMKPSEFQRALARHIEAVKVFVDQVAKCKACAELDNAMFDRCMEMRRLLNESY